MADIERGFRVLKSEIEIGPNYHRLPTRICAHAAICFMALILYRVPQRVWHAAHGPPNYTRGSRICPQSRIPMAATRTTNRSTEAEVDTDQYIVPALRRGLAVLRLFTHDRRVITLPEIVRELGVTRATAFRLAYTLEADGYLQRAPHSNAFQLGINLLSLGFEYLGSLDLVEVARPVLEDLRDRADASDRKSVV